MRRISMGVTTAWLIVAAPLAAQQPVPIPLPIAPAQPSPFSAPPPVPYGGPPPAPVSSQAPPAELINPPTSPGASPAPLYSVPPGPGMIGAAPAPIYAAPPPPPGIYGIFRPADNWEGRFWIRAEYLLWWVKDAPVPVPLVTIGSPNDAIPGAINQPNTQVLLGNQALDYGSFSGLRFDIGGWLDSSRTFGIEANAFYLERRTNDNFFGSDMNGFPLLAVPVNSNTPGATGQQAVVISAPGVFNGGIDVSTSLALWGTEINGMLTLLRDSNRRYELSLLAGFRYVDLEENLAINSFSNDMTSTPNTQTTFSDNFNTRNQFYGGQLGTRFLWQGERLSFDMTGKIALGATHESVDIQGYSSNFGPNANPSGVFNSGILAQPTNSNRYTATQFTVLPSLELKLGYQLTPHTRFFLGYDFMYWNQVVRPGNQINGTINASQSPILGTGTLAGPASPAPQFNRTDFWAQGVNFGFEVKY